MNALSILNDYKQLPVEHKGIGTARAIYALISEYNGMKEQITELHGRVMEGRFGEAFGYFVSAVGSNSLSETLRIERFFDLERAMCALDQDYWNRLLDVINVRNFMPASKRDLWHEDLDKWRKADRFSLANVKPLSFTREVVLMTAKRLSEERKDFFSEMVDGVFRNLSPKHFTNKAEGFGTRMIVASVMPSLERSYSNQEYVNDLRKVIGLMQNREGAETISSHTLFDSLKSRYGEWVSIDNDTIALKPHKNGTVHIDIAPELAEALNVVLAHRYPNVIPMKKVRGTKRESLHFIRDKSYQLYPEILSHNVCDQFCELSRRDIQPTIIDGVAFYQFHEPGSYLCSEVTREKVVQIFKMLGGAESISRKGQFLFRYNPQPVFEYIFINGTLPDTDSHQFYATKGEVRTRATDLLSLRDGHTLIEPSAGFGDLLAEITLNVTVTAIEIHPVAAATLKAKGFQTFQRDFLALKTAELPKYDRVLMNPPFSKGRWVRHIVHASDFLKPGGKLVAVLPASATEERLKEALGNEYDVLCSKECVRGFEGTAVNVTIVTVDRHE